MITHASLMCHAPIAIPEVAGPEYKSAVRSTTSSMVKAAQQIYDSKIDHLIIISPHTPRLQKHYGIVTQNYLNGSLESFDHPELAISFVSDRTLQNEILQKSAELKFPLRGLELKQLDHGSFVPLYFLNQVGFAKPVILISLPYIPTTKKLNHELAELLIQVSDNRNEKWGVLASGDMSHSLQRNGPAPFHPEAHLFDQFFYSQIENKNYREALQVPDKLRDLAYEDVYDTTEIALECVRFQSKGSEFFSYEAPFGVGYTVATLFAENGKHYGAN